MFKKLKDKLKKWEYKDVAVVGAKGFYQGYAAAAAAIYFIEFVKAKVTGKRLEWVDKK